MSGELSKVIIRGYQSPEENSQQGEVVGEYVAMFNPESFSVSNAFNYDESQAESDTGAEFKFKNIAPREFAFEFIIDATGAGGSKKDIEQEVTKFKNVTGFKEVSGFVGKERRSFYLTITWGTFNIRCIPKSIDVNFSLFRPNGTPVRAAISATFAEYKTPQQQARENPESILNLTQVRNVLDQDNLTNLAKQLYGDGKKYIDIAKANGINNLKELVSGSRLQFPPIDTLASTVQEQLGDQLAPFVDRAQNIVQGATRLAEGKGQIVESVTKLAERAKQQAQSAIAQTASVAGGIQSQVQTIQQQGRGLLGQAQSQIQALQQQGQSLVGQAQSQIQALQQQGQGIAGQVQTQIQALQQQGQSFAGQVQTQAGQFVQEASQLGQGIFNQLQNTRREAEDAGRGLLGEASGVIGGVTDAFSQGGLGSTATQFKNTVESFFDF